MNTSLKHLADSTLVHDAKVLVARDRLTTAELLVYLSEIDDRKLYVPAGHSCMITWCMHELGMSKDAARKRIHAARAARRFPAIFSAVAEGRLHLSTVLALAPCMTIENAEDLLSAAEGKSREEVELLIAARFPRPDLPSRVESPAPMLAAETTDESCAPGRTATSVFVNPPDPPAQVAPRSAERFGLQCTIATHAHELMRYAQALIGPRMSSSDIGRLVEMGFEALVEKLEKQRFGAAGKPRRNTRPKSRNPRHIPLAVRRAVWMRDQGRCTFVSENGHRCDACAGLQFDHIDAVARGGQSTVANLRLRCHAHNQYEAERTFGAAFMERKRENARQSRNERRARAVRAAEPELSKSAEEVVPWLRGLGFKIAEANAAAASCNAIPDAPLEARVRHALRYFKQDLNRTFAMSG